MIADAEPLAGVCLRPLGHLSVAAPYKANVLGCKGFFAAITLRSRRVSLQFRAAKYVNEAGIFEMPRTQRVHGCSRFEQEMRMNSEAWDVKVRVDPRVAAALGCSVEAVRLMNLRELANRAHDAGYEWSVTCGKAKSGDGKLTIRMDEPGFLGLAE